MLAAALGVVLMAGCAAPEPDGGAGEFGSAEIAMEATMLASSTGPLFEVIKENEPEALARIVRTYAVSVEEPERFPAAGERVAEMLAELRRDNAVNALTAPARSCDA